MNKTLDNIKTVEFLIEDEYFTCTKSVDEEGRIEYSFKMYKSIDDTVERLVKLYEIEKAYFETIIDKV